MIFNDAVLKRLIKLEWKNEGIKLGYDANEQNYIIAGSTWVITVSRYVISNKALAALIEIAGELPGNNEMFEIKKDAENQMEIMDRAVWDIGIKATDVIYATNIFINGLHGIRLMQNPKTKQIAKIHNMFVDLIDISGIDTEREDKKIEGPFYDPVADGFVYRNNECTFMCLGINKTACNVATDDVIAVLERINLPISYSNTYHKIK